MPDIKPIIERLERDCVRLDRFGDRAETRTAVTAAIRAELALLAAMTKAKA